MTKEDKAKLGARHHLSHDCDMCPYSEGSEIMLDPRIDPDYGAHVMKKATHCRDELIDDLASMIGE